MLKKLIATIIAAAGLILSMQAAAHQNHHNRDHGRHHKPVKPTFSVNKAQSIQASLINKGVKNRSLTRYEEKKLRQEQKSIAQLEHKYRRHGLQHWERNILEKRLKSSYKRIKTYMNNHERRRVKKHSRHSHKTWNHSSNGGSVTFWISSK